MSRKCRRRYNKYDGDLLLAFAHPRGASAADRVWCTYWGQTSHHRAPVAAVEEGSESTRASSGAARATVARWPRWRYWSCAAASESCWCSVWWRCWSPWCCAASAPCVVCLRVPGGCPCSATCPSSEETRTCTSPVWLVATDPCSAPAAGLSSSSSSPTTRSSARPSAGRSSPPDPPRSSAASSKATVSTAVFLLLCLLP